jgi:hypothetical protein
VGLALGNELSGVIVIDSHDTEHASGGKEFVVIRNADREELVTFSLVWAAFKDHLWFDFPDVPVGDFLFLANTDVFIEVSS